MTSHLWQTARIGLYVVLGLLAYHFVRTVGRGDTALDTWLSAGKAQHATVAKLLARDAQHRHEAQDARQHAAQAAQQTQAATQRFQVLASAFRQHLDSEHTIPDTAAFATVVRACYDAVHLCQARGDSLQRADSLDAARADSLLGALRRSDSSLTVGLTVAQCRWLVIPCPTRTHALELGIALGLIGGWVLSRR